MVTALRQPRRLDTPIGRLDLTVADDGTLVGLDFGDRDISSGPPAVRTQPGTAVEEVIEAYFDGDLDALDDIPVRFDTGTEFQRLVWGTLRSIPAGRTISYAELADRVGRPTAFRAVGAANGQNPVPLVVPCHRVIASDGGLGGYGGGLDRKRWLLDHEAGRPALILASPNVAAQS